jgi:hypothetical protein
LKHRLEEAKYTVLRPEDLWHFYLGAGALYRGGGGLLGPKILRANGPRAHDVTVIYDHDQEIEVVVPDATKGLSFADSIQKLSKRPTISGHVWVLPRSETLPEGLVFNVKERDHPLLNVGRRMSLAEFAEKLRVLSGKMQYARVRIEKGTGRIVEDVPGAMSAGSR